MIPHTGWQQTLVGELDAIESVFREMTSTVNSASLIETAISDGIRAYAASRRQLIEPFVEKHFSFQGAWQINKRAVGWDIARAPANLLWAPLYFFGKGAGKALRLARATRAADVLDKLPAGFATDVEREVEWLLYSEFLALPYQAGDRSSSSNALLECILSQGPFLQVLEETLSPVAERASDPAFRERLETALSGYVNNRKAVAELATSIVSIATGLASYKQLSAGALGIGQATAAVVAQQIAVSNFFLGPALGSVYYSLFPAAASAGLLVTITGGVAAAMGVISAFAGVITDPAQKALGLHQKKLHSLVDAMEASLLGDAPPSMKFREGLLTRLLDFVDLIAAAVPKVA